jgi:hypothetical protein
MVSQLQTATIGGRESYLYDQKHELQTRASKGVYFLFGKIIELHLIELQSFYCRNIYFQMVYCHHQNLI